MNASLLLALHGSPSPSFIVQGGTWSRCHEGTLTDEFMKIEGVLGKILRSWKCLMHVRGRPLLVPADCELSGWFARAPSSGSRSRPAQTSNSSFKDLSPFCPTRASSELGGSELDRVRLGKPPLSSAAPRRCLVACGHVLWSKTAERRPFSRGGPGQWRFVWTGELGRGRSELDFARDLLRAVR